MKLTESSLANPTAVLVAVLLALMFGLVSLFRLPIQLIPEIKQPELTITTTWRAAAPNEVEAEIIEPQEDVLRGLPGVTKLLASAKEGVGEITLTFRVDMSLDRALIEVINRLNQVPSYPEDADEPVINTVGSNENAIAWFRVYKEEGNDREMASYHEFVEDVVQTRIERVPGVAESELFGARESELRITFDPYKAASLGIEMPVVSRLAGSGEDISGGMVEVGKRQYSVRFSGKYEAGDLQNLIIEWRDGKPIYLRDVARIEKTLVDEATHVVTQGDVSIAINAKREVGVNVLEVMEDIYQAIGELRNGSVRQADLNIEQIFDETKYINNSIDMVRNNLGLGFILAVGILWWFLRKFRATLIVAVAIPVCLISSFLFLFLGGRTINIISLAGLAFAVGMVMDASIVVLENIVRLRERGSDSHTASLKGASQIAGALLASTATTIAIFLPIVFLRDEAGQIFADLAITIAATVCISLIVALTVVPTFANKILHSAKLEDPHQDWWRKITQLIMAVTGTPRKRYAWIVGLIVLPVSLAFLMIPNADYLPVGNQNFAFGIIRTAPGSNIQLVKEEVAAKMVERIRPYYEKKKEPYIQHYFVVSNPGLIFAGLEMEDDSDYDKLVPLLYQFVSGFPDTIAFANRVSLFSGFGEGRTIDMNFQATSLEAATGAALMGFLKIPSFIPGAMIRPFPGLELAQPELRLIPNERRIAEAGWTRETVASVTRALVDGLYVGDYFDGERTLDIIVRSEAWETPEELASLPLATQNAGILPLGELVNIVRTAGPEEIRRLNRRRTVTLQIKPPDHVSLEEALEILQTQVEPEVRGFLPEDGAIEYTGDADKLQLALASMQGSFLLAIAILYLLMSALFRSFKDSLLVMFTIPLATVGGIIMLKFINVVPNVLGFNVFQSMDLLTMIGFIILLGLVVNNAILLVHQARMAERQHMPRKDAVEQAISFRLRPILMSTLTSIFGMLPLLLVPGAGTELYRGLAGVIVGGMVVSTVFTLILLPSFLRLGEERSITA